MRNFSSLCFVFMLFMLTSAFVEDAYKIDASTTTKKVTQSNYVMGTPTNLDGGSITLNNYYLIKDGKPWLPVMGEMHYARYPDNLWEDAVMKMKAGGLDVIATYCFWIHHEEIQGQFDFTGRRNLREFAEICKNKRMYVLLRLGPFCNGEVRNGGLPDWIRKQGIKARSNDPEYLKLVRILYKQYFEQIKGLLYKDGGPIIGVQLDNELNNPNHILELKKIAREAGFDVPLYTVTGWNNVVIPEKEVIPVQAGYPDDFWSMGIERNSPNTQYLFMTGIPINTGVGTDVLPVLETYGQRTYNPSDYPWMLAELGLGMQWTHSRRPVIDEKDAGALMTVKLAGGANCIGYYMYLGGSNPDGKLTPLNSGRGMPLVSYDYQGAISEFGEMPRKYHVLKLSHYFLQDFGSSLAPMIPSMPSRSPANVEDVNTFRCMVRADHNSGYLFFSNYQRYVENKDLKDVQLQVKLGESTVTIPSKPITIPKDVFGIWPINLKLNGAELVYSTAQVFARFTGKDVDTYFFFSHKGISPEFVFNNATVADINASGNIHPNIQNGLISIIVDNPGLSKTMVVKPKKGKRIRICVLPYEMALHATRLDLWGQSRLVITDGADPLSCNNNLDLLSSGQNMGSLWIYPAPQTLHVSGNSIQSRQEGIFTKFDWTVEGKELPLKYLKTSSAENTQYELSIPSNALDGVYDVQLDIAHICDYMTAKLDDHLLGDRYYYGPHYRPSLLHWGKQVIGKTISFELTPLTDQTKCFIEKKYRPDFNLKKSYAEIESLQAIPVYRITLY